VGLLERLRFLAPTSRSDEIASGAYRIEWIKHTKHPMSTFTTECTKGFSSTALKHSG
jgi:hypothetical protein